MSSVTKLPDQKTRYDQASLWVAKMDRELTAQEKHELGVWLSESVENQNLLMEMTKQWDKMDSLSRLSSIFPRHHSQKNYICKTSGILRQLANYMGALSRPALAIPALFLIVFAVTTLKLAEQAPDTSAGLDLVVYETEIGEQSSIILPDGSHMRLNTDTLVQVSYTPKERLLELVHGELNIDVAHDTDRPLKVQANGRVVQAIGTAFNVEITEQQEVEVVVTDGKVIVTQNTLPAVSADKGATAPTTKVAAEEPIAISAGEEILLGSSDQKLKKILPEDARIKLSWQQGNLVFRGESLEQAMAEVSRYTPVEFIFLDEASKDVRIAGLFKAGDTANLLSSLQETFNVRYEWADSEKVLLSAR